jgi:lactate 2-monooxygenase
MELNEPTQLNRPRTNEITLSLLRRAKRAGFSVLVLTLDTFSIGWRPHDLASAYLPFIHGFGNQVGTSDPVFMRRFQLPALLPGEATPAFPYDPQACDALIAAGDAHAQKQAMLGKAWLGEVTGSSFRSWEDLKFLRDNWEGPLVLKGVQRVAVRISFLLSYLYSFCLFSQLPDVWQC